MEIDAVHLMLSRSVTGPATITTSFLVELSPVIFLMSLSVIPVFYGRFLPVCITN